MSHIPAYLVGKQKRELVGYVEAPKEKWHWSFNESAIMACLDVNDGKLTYGGLKKYLVDPKLRQWIIETKQKRGIPITSWDTKRNIMSEPILSKNLDNLESEGVIKSRWVIPRKNSPIKSPTKIYEITRKYKRKIAKPKGISPNDSYYWLQMVSQAGLLLAN